MNISKVVSSLIMEHALYGIALPFKNQQTGEPIPAENVVMDVIKTMTIPRYSQVEPWIREGSINIGSMKCIDREKAVYMLPAILTMTPILWVNDVSLPTPNNRGTFGDVAPAYGINRSVQGVITSNAYMMLAGQMRAEPTFKYLGHNKIQLYGFPRTEVIINVACEHMTNGETIPDGCYASFYQLAALDLEIFLYSNLSLFEDQPTAFGNLKPKIEQYQGSKDKREALLDKWDDTYHVDQIDWIKFM